MLYRLIFVIYAKEQEMVAAIASAEALAAFVVSTFRPKHESARLARVCIDV